MALVEVALHPPLATVTLNRPEKRNALCVALRDELERALDALAKDPTVKVVILTGKGCFCAGYDLEEMRADLGTLLHRLGPFTERTAFFEKPVVTAVAGYAIAGGFDLALAGDVIVAAEGAQLGRAEVQWGVNPFLARLSQRLGVSRALRLSLTGARIDAAEALAMGLVDRVVPPAQLMEVALAKATALARPPLETLLALKRAARAVGGEPRAAVDFEAGLTAELVASGVLEAQLRAHIERTLKK